MTGLLKKDTQLSMMDEVAKKFAEGEEFSGKEMSAEERKRIENLRELLAYYTANYNCGFADGKLEMTAS